MKRHNPYKKKKTTHMDKKLLDQIGWSKEDIRCFVKDVEEEEKVGIKNEEVETKKIDISATPRVFSPPCQKQTVASAAKSVAAKITPEQKATIHVNRE